MTSHAMLKMIEDSELDTLIAVLHENPNTRIVKYSPGKRCLLAVEKNGRSYFAKVYPKKFMKHARGEKIHLVGEKLRELADMKQVSFRIPKPVCWDSATRTLWQEELTGAPAEVFLRDSAKNQTIFAIGQGIGEISKVEIAPPRFFDRREQLKDTVEFVRRMGVLNPEDSALIEKLMAVLGDAELPGERAVPIHGDMHPQQWLFENGSPGLLDFEDFSLGEVERDLASFLVQLEAENGLNRQQHETVFLDGFRASGSDFDSTLVNYYAAHKWIAKASKKPAKAAEFLTKALDSLELSK